MPVFRWESRLREVSSPPKVTELVNNGTKTDLPPSVFDGALQLSGQSPTFSSFLLQPQLGLVDCLLPLGNHLQELDVLGAGRLQFPR